MWVLPACLRESNFLPCSRLDQALSYSKQDKWYISLRFTHWNEGTRNQWKLCGWRGCKEEDLWWRPCLRLKNLKFCMGVPPPLPPGKNYSWGSWFPKWNSQNTLVQKSIEITSWTVRYTCIVCLGTTFLFVWTDCPWKERALRSRAAPTSCCSPPSQNSLDSSRNVIAILRPVRSCLLIACFHL